MSDCPDNTLQTGLLLKLKQNLIGKSIKNGK